MDSNDTYRRVVELVDVALDLEPSERSGLLDRECAGQPELRLEVESLLAEAELDADGPSSQGFLANPAALELADLVADSAEMSSEPGSGGSADIRDQPTPAWIGPYRVLEELGRGGMGTVYLAEQREPIERRVALKVIRAVQGEKGSRRFAAECRALARLKHPNIAAVYDAGVADDGRAFVAMEWVEGAHITAWCDHKKLPIQERIELFLGICAGVSHAHQKGLVHRDLKPSNVLVAEVDGKATAKVIDFGIARTLDDSEDPGSEGQGISADKSRNRSLEVSRSLVMGSPLYMSPEAADLENRSDVDTRTDVYSLGILFYELVIGILPFNVKGLGLVAILNHIRTADPPSIFRRWEGLSRERRDELSELRGISAERLGRSLRGDLDAISIKATARDPESRYGAVADLAADLTRHLNHRPVEARELTWTYQLSRYVRRNLGAVVAVAVVISVLLGGIAARTQEARRANLEAERANLEAERARQALDEAEQVSEFLIGLFEVVDPDRRADDPQSVDELLAKAEATMDEELANQPVARARFLQTIGRIAMNRTDLDHAVNLYEQALELREQHQAADDPDLITTVGSLGVIYRRQGRLDKAEASLTRAIHLLEGTADPDPAQFAATLTWLANLHFYQRRLEDAIEGHRRALEIRRREDPINPGAIAESLNNLGVALRDLGRYAEAKPILQEAGRYFLEAFGAEHPFTVGTWFNLAGVEERLGHWSESENMIKKARDAWLEIHGPTHHRTLLASRQLGSLWLRWGRTEEALAHLRGVLGAQEADPGMDDLELARTELVLARTLIAKGDFEVAEELLKGMLETYSDIVAGNQYFGDSIRANAAIAKWKQGHVTQAALTLQRLAESREEAMGDRHPGVAWLYRTLGEALLDEGKLPEAEAALNRSLSMGEVIQEGPSVAVGRDLLLLGRLRRAQGREAEASELLRRSVEMLEQVVPPEHPDLMAARAEI